MKLYFNAPVAASKTMTCGAEPAPAPTTKIWLGRRTAVVTLAVLSDGFRSAPAEPSSAVEAVLVICRTPAGSGLDTVTAKRKFPEVVPAARSPTAWVKTPPPWSIQPGLLNAALNLVLAGT